MVAVAAIILVIFIARMMRNGPPQMTQSPATPASDAVGLTTASQLSVDDDSAITAAFGREGYVLDGPIVDIDGIAGGPKLHVARTRCTSNESDCTTKLFVFDGNKAVWSEAICVQFSSQ